MADPYTGEIMYSRDVTQLMRDINALEADVAGSLQEPRMDRIAVDGTYAYLMSVEAGKVYKFALSDWSLSTSWALPSIADTLGFSDIATNGTYIYVSTAQSLTGDYGTGSIHRYNTTGAQHASIEVTDVLSMECANDALYLVRGLPEEVLAGVTGTVPHVEKRTLDGDLVWQTRGYLARYSIGVDSQYVYITTPGVFYGTISRINDSDGTLEDPYAWSIIGSTGPWIHSDGTYTYSVSGSSSPSITKRDADTGTYVSETSYPSAVISWPIFDSHYYDGKIYWLSSRTIFGGPDAENEQVFIVDTSDMSISTANDLVTSDAFEQTRWYAYTEGAKRYLGDPDGGVSVPALEALSTSDDAGQTAGLVATHILDMRAAVQRLAPYYENAGTSNAFNWTDSSEDNLYYVAMGDRSDYGATGGARYDWTRDYAAMVTPPYNFCYGLDIGEVYECVSTLQGSALV